MPLHFEIRTFGCQMNQHDAEKISNLLHHADYRPADPGQTPDLILLHTCSVREKAERKLYSELAELLPLKRRHPQLLIGVGGCVAQQEGAALLERFADLDFVFGPQHVRHLPAMIEGAKAHLRSLRVDYDDDPQQRFELPERHPEFEAPRPGRAFVTVMEGCDLFCAFCVVPRTRGREVSRPSAAILAEVRAAAQRGVVEITLLGQTVNAYGRPRPGRASGEIPFAELLRRVAEVPGIERVRFTSPHPIFVTPELIRAYADEPRICPHLHLPVQSGSSRVLAAMSRRYDRETYLEIVRALRAARPDVALTTDLIVGFPGETREDFEETLSLMSEAAFTDSFSFKYSARPGTPVLRRDLAGVPADEAQARLEELQALQRQLTLRAHRARVGETCQVLVDGPSRRGGTQLTGRCPQNRVVNFSAPVPPAPGTLAELRIVDATPHSLLAEVPVPVESAFLPLL
jgi:tRNA-2-methylthio-N6-dimethylallyladenosine synthase